MVYIRDNYNVTAPNRRTAAANNGDGSEKDDGLQPEGPLATENLATKSLATVPKRLIITRARVNLPFRYLGLNGLRQCQFDSSITSGKFIA